MGMFEANYVALKAVQLFFLVVGSWEVNATLPLKMHAIVPLLYY